MRLKSVPDPGKGAVLVAHPSGELYGADRVMLESVAAMVARGWRVIVTLPETGPLVSEIQSREAEVILCPAPVLRKSALRPAGFLELMRTTGRCLLPASRIIRSNNCAVIYVSTLTIPSWMLVGRLLGVPVVCHVHEAEGSASALLRWMLALPLLAADRVILNSRFSLDVLTTSVGRLRRRCQVIYNGVAGPATVRSAREELSSPVRLLFIGRLSPRKGAQVAIAALKDLTERGVLAQLDLLGSVFPGYEWFDQELKKTVQRESLDARVNFLGFRRDVWPEIADADIVLVPSIGDEPFGNTAVEALLAARPLIASATTGLKEAANGYAAATFVNAGNSATLADAVVKVVDNWDTFRAAALDDRSIAEERHSLKKYRESIGAVLDEVSTLAPVRRRI